MRSRFATAANRCIMYAVYGRLRALFVRIRNEYSLGRENAHNDAATANMKKPSLVLRHNQKI
jgi:hypothetical protein